jgi:hypothetical protein
MTEFAPTLLAAKDSHYSRTALATETLPPGTEFSAAETGG